MPYTGWKTWQPTRAEKRSREPDDVSRLPRRPCTTRTASSGSTSATCSRLSILLPTSRGRLPSALRIGKGSRDVTGQRDDEVVVCDQRRHSRFGEGNVRGVVCGKSPSRPIRDARQFRLLELEAELVEGDGQLDQRVSTPLPSATRNVDDLESQQRRRCDGELTRLERGAERAGRDRDAFPRRRETISTRPRRRGRPRSPSIAFCPDRVGRVFRRSAREELVETRERTSRCCGRPGAAGARRILLGKLSEIRAAR